MFFQISSFKFKIARKRRAFTLTEIVIILGIVGIIISGILPLFVTTIAAGRSGSYYSNAYKIADSKMESYRNMNFDSIASEQLTLDEIPNGELQTEITNELDGRNEADIKRVELTIRWHYKRDQNIKLVTYIYRGGL